MKYAKAVVAALIAGLSAAAAAVPDGITASEGIGIALAFCVALGAVWAVPNKVVM